MNKINKQSISMTSSMTSTSFLYTTVFIVLSAAILSTPFVYGLKITEIMFNPEGADTGREWIEITLNESDGCVNLTEYKLFEEGTNHNIYAYNNTDTYNADHNNASCKYAMIVTDVNKFLQDYRYLNNTINSSNIILYRSTFSLNNGGEMIAIKHDNNIIDKIDYAAILGIMNVTEGYSLEYYEDYWRQSVLLNGNPGDIINYITEDIVENTTNDTYNNTDNITNNATNNTTNNISNNITDEIVNNTINTTNQNISENTTLNSTINVTENISTNNTNNDTYAGINDTDQNNTIDINSTDSNGNNNNNNNSNSTSSSCHASISIFIKNDSTFYNDSAQIRFYNKIDINDTTGREINYSIEYWVEDVLGNMVKNKITTNNQNEKTFTPNIYDKDEILFIKNVLRDIDCNMTINSSEKMLLIKNTNYIPPKAASASSSSCNNKATKCEPCVCKITSCAQDSNTNISSIKIVNVCSSMERNASKNSTAQLSQNNITQNSKGISAGTGIINNVTLSNVKNTTQDTGKATGMMVYESPNLKNRLYALIGLILVGLTCISLVTYKILSNKHKKE